METLLPPPNPHGFFPLWKASPAPFYIAITVTRLVANYQVSQNED
jgi:hypothetical protein